MKRKFIFLGLLCALFAATARADAGNNLLSAGIRKAQQAHVVFKPYHLFTITGGEKHTSVLSRETQLLPNAYQIEELFSSKPEAVSFYLADENGQTFRLNLLKSHPFAHDATISTADANGVHVRSTPDLGLHYQGAMDGKEQSVASVSVFADGTVTVLFGDQLSNYIVGKLKDGSGKYIFYNDRDMTAPAKMPCATIDPPPTIPHEMQPAGRGTAITICRKVQLYWELDYQLYTFYSFDTTATQNYAASLFNNMQTLYNNDGIAVELKTLVLNTTPDTYPTSSANNALAAFKTKWNATNDNFVGDLAHLITKDGANNGGAAHIDVLCNRSFSYAYSEILNNLSAVPTYSWDVEVVTHETGHNLGSNHTHWCGWNTGAGGTCGAIDDCVPKDAGNGCTTCTATSTSGTGTIMSYCHLNSGRGIAFGNGFGPLPKAVIQTEVTNASCLNSIISATITPTDICNNNDGAVSVAINANNFGVAPLSYTWSNSATSQSISGLSTAGTYTVTIRDANNCSNALAATVLARPSPGNGNAYGGLLPISCSSTGQPAITAALPKQLSACQTVAWLRTTTPIASLAAAQTAFNSAAAADKMFSTNAASVSTTTAARLNVARPATCTGPVTYYYTPFVSQKVKTANTYTDAPFGSGFVGTPAIGKFVAFSDVAGTPTACDLLYSPTTQSISLTVAGYNGTTNDMTIQVQTPAGALLYNASGLAGNNTYTIPLSGISGGALQSLYVLAYSATCTGTCNPSTWTLSGTRTITYPAVTTPTFETACAAGTSVMMSYAPGGNAPLPMSLLSFKGEMAGKANLLNWETASEANMDRFTLERAADGKSFISIHTVVAANQPANSYRILDEAPLTESYYRLRIKERSGEISYSNIVSIIRQTSSGNIISIFPNPAQQEVTLQLAATSKEDLMVNISNTMGQVIYRRRMSAMKGSNEWKIGLSEWARGIYFVTIFGSEGTHATQRLILE
jgi:hypothetical protein